MRSSHLLIALVFPLGVLCAASCSSSGRSSGGGSGGNASTSGGGGGGSGRTGSSSSNSGGGSGVVFAIDSRPPPIPGDDDGLKPTCESDCPDFPADPIVEDGAPTSGYDGSGSLCILEPQDGSMFPNGHADPDDESKQPKWMRPRVMIASPKSGDTYKITVHADREANDLVVYTKSMPWYMPRDIWANLSQNVLEEDITIEVHASSGGSSKTTIRIAPVDVSGSIVFWNANNTLTGGATTRLLGFRPADEGVVTVLLPNQVKTVMLNDNAQPKQLVESTATDPGAKAGEVRCVGCHTSTPDGKAVAITDHWPWNVAIASLENVGAIPDYVTRAGRLMAQSPWQGVTSFSKKDWESGARRYVTSFAPRTADPDPGKSHEFWPGDAKNTASNKDNLIWIDLAAEGEVPEPTPTSGKNPLTTALIKLKGTVWDIIPRTGDTRGAVTPDWSHDGTTIAYTSADATSDGRVGRGVSGDKDLTVCDIYTVPIGGGEAKPVKGAAESGAAEYYPDYSPDDQFIAFNRVGNMTGEMYYRSDAELYVVPAAGGEASRLAANDPPKCSGKSATAVYNSWPKWGPLAKKAGDSTYYFLTFSSTRYSTDTIPGATGKPPIPASELFLATIKVDGDGKITSFPAIYLWNQRNLITGTGKDAKVSRSNGLNLTPAWDDFAIPKVPPVEDILR